jgi:hypothetical protein
MARQERVVKFSFNRRLDPTGGRGLSIVQRVKHQLVPPCFRGLRFEIHHRGLLPMVGHEPKIPDADTSAIWAIVGRVIVPAA